MFIEFQVGNFRSFRDIQKFTMQAAPKRANDIGLEEGNVFETDGFRLLKSKAIYGSNASGKSNLAKAISAFTLMVSKSVRFEDIAKRIWEDRFQLLTDWDDQPVFFQYICIVNNLTYRYGFQILEGKIYYEWLFERAGEKEEECFIRTKEAIKIEEKYFGNSRDLYIEQILSGDNEVFSPDALFLTGAAVSGNKFAGLLRNQIGSVISVDGIEDGNAVQAAMHDLDKGTEEEKSTLKQLIRAADTGIEDLELLEASESLIERKFPKELLQLVNDKNKIQTLYASHSRYNENGEKVETISVPFMEWESQGTRKILSIGALVLKSLRSGRTLMIDEFDARFHPNLTLKIVQLFHSKETNPLNAQLIFITHDSGLLRRADLRRDQICFVNKDKYGISSLKTLIEYKGVRKDASYEKEYLNGSYDAVPYLNEMDWVVTNNISENGL